MEYTITVSNCCKSQTTDNFRWDYVCPKCRKICTGNTKQIPVIPKSEIADVLNKRKKELEEYVKVDNTRISKIKLNEVINTANQLNIKL